MQKEDPEIPDMDIGMSKNKSDPVEVSLDRVVKVGDDLLSRDAVSSAARASLLCSEREQVFPRTYRHRQCR